MWRQNCRERCRDLRPLVCCVRFSEHLRPTGKWAEGTARGLSCFHTHWSNESHQTQAPSRPSPTDPGGHAAYGGGERRRVETFSKNAFHVDPELPCSQQSCEPGPGAISQSAVGKHVARGSSCPEMRRAQGLAGPQGTRGQGQLAVWLGTVAPAELQRTGLEPKQAASLPGRGLCVPIRTTASRPGSARKAEAVHPKISFILPPPRRAGAGNGQKECWRPSQTWV